MTVNASDRDGVAVLAVDGEVDLSTSPRLREALQKALASSKKGVVVDLAACGYMDSSGIATLVEALQAAGKAGAAFALAGVAGRVQDIFTLARLESVFRTYPDAGAAVRSITA